MCKILHIYVQPGLYTLYSRQIQAIESCFNVFVILLNNALQTTSPNFEVKPKYINFASPRSENVARALSSDTYNSDANT